MKPIQPTSPQKLPIHFKLPGRSYAQIGRKGNIALYAVYSDYIIVPDFALPYALIGYELIAIKVWKGRETYPNDSEFGSRAWSIPKLLCSSLSWLWTPRVWTAAIQRIAICDVL